MFPMYNHEVVDKPGTASIECVTTEPILDETFSDNLNYDDEVNRLLDQVEEEFLRDKPKNSDIPKGTPKVLRDKPKDYDVFNGSWKNFDGDKPKNYDFPEDTHHVGSIPDWYRDMLTSKIQKAKSRLENLSKLVCATSPSTAAHIKRIEEDHSTVFCKMDYPRHPPMHKPWRSTWEFRYVKKCNETESSNHSHLVDCQDVVVEDVRTGVRVNSPNVSQHDYPPHVVCTARLFKNFARNMAGKIYRSKVKEKSECEKKPKCKNKSKGMLNVNAIKDDWWTTISMVLISNHLHELMIIVRQEKVKCLIPHLKAYFKEVIGAHPNIVSVLATPHANMNVNMKHWLTKLFKENKHKTNSFELLIVGTPVLKDEIGPLTIEYDLANYHVFLDSIETMQLGKAIQDYMCLTKETTLLDIGSNFGVLSLIMAHKCEKVVKLISLRQAQLTHQTITESNKLKNANDIRNVLFTGFKKSNVAAACAPLINQCITVAIVKLNFMTNQLGRLQRVMKSLRNLPSIWRVIVYGSFTDQFHESIALLTSENNSGERYLPMQGCILDKSPKAVDDFDLVILFERKSRIAPKVKLFAPGLTVNLAVDSETSDDDSMDEQELSSDKDRELANSEEEREERLPLSTNDQRVPSLSGIKEFRFDHPPPSLQTIPRFSHPPPPETETFQFNIPPPAIHPNITDPLLNLRFPNLNFHPEPYPPLREDLQFISPPFVIYSNVPIRPDPHAPIRNDFQDHYYPPLPPENYYNPPHHLEPCPVINNEFQYHYRLQPPPPPLPPAQPLCLPKHKKLKRKEIKPQFFYPPPPPTRFPSPPPPPPLPPADETDLIEKDSNISSVSMTMIDVSLRVCKEEKVSEVVNTAEDLISSVVIKSELGDPSYSIIFPEANSILSETNCDSPTSTIKDKLVQVCEEMTSEIVNAAEDSISSVRIKSQPVVPNHFAAALEDNNILSESSCYSSTTTVKAEPLQYQEKKESNLADSGSSSNIAIKTNLANQSSSVNFSETNCQNIPLAVTVKSESKDFSPVKSPDYEPTDMQISPSPPDFQSMETPIHNPRVLNDIIPMTVSKNVSVDGSKFQVQTNQSFFGKVEPVDADREPGEISDSDEEYEAIGEEKNQAPIMSRKLNRPPRPYPGEYSDSQFKRLNRKRLPGPKGMRRSPPPDKRRRRSPTPDKRRRRSPFSDRWRDRSRRSPLNEAHVRARSPRDRRNRRSRSRSPWRR